MSPNLSPSLSSCFSVFDHLFKLKIIYVIEESKLVGSIENPRNLQFQCASIRQMMNVKRCVRITKVKRRKNKYIYIYIHVCISIPLEHGTQTYVFCLTLSIPLLDSHCLSITQCFQTNPCALFFFPDFLVLCSAIATQSCNYVKTF